MKRFEGELYPKPKLSMFGALSQNYHLEKYKHPQKNEKFKNSMITYIALTVLELLVRTMFCICNFLVFYPVWFRINHIFSRQSG